MSKNINVNPGAYKVAGRERPGRDRPTNLERQKFAREKAKDQLVAATRAGRRAGAPPKPRKPGAA